MSDSTRTRFGRRIYRWVVVGSVILCFVIFAVRESFFRWIGKSLVNEESVGTSNAILIDGMGRYLLFEHAQRLQAQGLADVILIPVSNSGNTDRPALVSLGFVDVMCRISRVRNCTVFDAPERE